MPKDYNNFYFIGALVRIRSWEDMEEEFGSSAGNIQTPCVFTFPMKEFCGQVTSIIRIDDMGGSLVFTLKDNWGYNFDEGMFEPIETHIEWKKYTS